ASGMTLSLIAAGYCFKSATGAWPKIRSMPGSTTAIVGGSLLALGVASYMATSRYNNSLNTLSWDTVKDVCFYASHEKIKPLTQDELSSILGWSSAAALGGTVLSLLSYGIQPKDEKQA